MKIRMIAIAALAALGLVLTGCKDKKNKSGDKQKSQKQQEMKKEKKAAKDKGGEDKDKAKKDKEKGDFDKEVVLNPKGNQMKFKQETFTVKPGQKIKLVFHNTADAKAMKHNVIVVSKAEGKGGKKAAKRIADKGMKAGKKNDFEPKEDKALMASTGIVEPGGNRATITFTAPEKPGKYPYICTYPGHFPMMQGDMIVEK